MEHRHYREHRVARTHAHHIGLQLPHRMEVTAAMGVGDALRRAGGARSEAEPRGAVLVELAPGDIGRGACEHGFERADGDAAIGLARITFRRVEQ